MSVTVRLVVSGIILVVAAAVVTPAAATGGVNSGFHLAPISFQACEAGAEYIGPARRQVPPDVWLRVSDRSIDQKLPAAVLAALDRVAGDLSRRAPAVSIAVAIPGKGRWSFPPGQPRFQAASTTKTFTAAVIMALEAEGRLSLDQTIERWFPDVPNASITTIDDLLRHTSGLVSFNALPSWTLDFREPRQAIRMATAEPPQFCPGTHFAYTNTGYVMLGVIAEAIEGAPLHDIFQRRFVAPLGLANTALRRRGDDLAVVTGHVGGQPVEVPDAYATPYAAGGLATTAEDLVTFWHALLNGRVLPTVRSMFTDMAPMEQSGQMFYGRGVQFYEIPQGPGLMLGHSGGITGFTSVVAWLPADEMYVAVILNEQQAPAEAGLWAVVRAVREAR